MLIGPDGRLADGEGWINQAAYNIHWPVHEARPDIVSAAHTHTPYGTPFSALVEHFRPITQESCAFYEDHEIFDDEEVDILSTDGGNDRRRARQRQSRHPSQPWPADGRRERR